MVRLKEANQNISIQQLIISIPVWYGWKTLVGSEYIIIHNFNSSMVRLKERHSVDKNRINFISIPVWYGWKPG